MANLKELEVLTLADNNFYEFPKTILQLGKLHDLDLSNNLISTLPASIHTLSGLVDLNVSNNRLLTLPNELGKLRKLKVLDISNKSVRGGLGRPASTNRITALPPEIRNWQNLQTLDLRGNPLSALPPEIIARVNEPHVILTYYFDHLNKPLHEVKLLIVGQGSVGKTSLVERILHNTFSSFQTKTEGIAISEWQVAVGTSNELDGENRTAESDRPSAGPEGLGETSYQNLIRLNIWDFGGQEIMHATHQFFLTKRSVYLLVLDSRLTQEENRVEYWLKIIQSFGAESPVLIVGNKTDQHPLDIDRTGLRSKYDNIAGKFETSAATGAGIKELCAAITTQVNSLPHVRDLLPETWFAIKTRLERLGRDKNYISRDEYVSLCRENNVGDDPSQDTLIGFLHDLGVVLHFQDDPRLEALGILNPQWVTNGVYNILNSHQLFQNKGLLTLSMLNDILKLPEYPRDKRLFIVDMMRKFELCYDIEPNKTFLVPDLLPKDEPYIGDWTGGLAFQYHYNVLPSSIISRFIVRMNAFIHRTVWRSGVVLKSGGNDALVKGDTEERMIYIWVRGEETTRRDFLSAIRTQFDAIHKSVAKMEIREKVPVPKYPSAVVDYQHLLKLERKGVPDFIPEGLDDSISVRKLLDGVSAPSDRQRDLVDASHREHGVGLVGDTVQRTSVVPKVTPAERRPRPQIIMSAVFVDLPRVLGRAILDVFGRDKAAESTSIIIGYVVILVGVLLLWGILDMSALTNAFKGTWRFFFPIESP